VTTTHLDADTLAAYVDGRLADDELGRVDRHIDGCGTCRRELSSLAALASEPRGGDAKLPEGALGRYEILREIGHGAMGIVLRAYDPELARPVAIKLVRDTDGGTRELVRTEARALAKLRHPNVVTVYDVIVDDGRMYIAMELVEGDTLRGFCKNRPRRDALAACVLAGRGLAAAHEAGVIHRDFKPDNVLVTDRGEARVSDFGLAATEGDTTFAGTPAYMAPEVLAREPATAASDQYSYCVSVYEMLTGRRPDAGGAELPGWTARVLARGLERDPAARYPSMTALVNDLERDPAAIRRRRAIYAGGALVAVATGALAVHLVTPAAPSCAIDDAALGDAWNDGKKLDVGRAFGSDADTGGNVAAALDDYARTWIAARRSACEATRETGEQSEVVLDRRYACLERGRRELGELTRVLATADAKTAAAAPEAVHRLPDPAACTAAEAGSETALTRALLESGRTVIDRATALELLGKLDDASALLSALAAAPQPQLAGEAMLIEARIETDRAHHDRAEATLFAALAAAERAHDDRLIAGVWVEIVMTTGAQQHRFELAKSNARAADAALARIEPSADLLTRYNYSLGGMLLAHGEIAAARTRLEAGLASAGDDPHRRDQAGAIRVSLCDAYRQLGDFATARAQCHQGIELLEAALGHDHPRLAIALNTQAVLDFTAHDLEAAERGYQRAIEIFERRGATDHLVYALALSNLGAVYSSRDHIDQARTYFERALAMFDAHHREHPQRLMPLQGLASLALRSGDAVHAVEYYERVRDGMAATYAADSPTLVTAEYNLTLAYRAAKQPAKAQELTDALIARALAPGKEQWLIAARALDSSATLADDRKDYAAAITLRDRALAAIAHIDDFGTRAMIEKQVGVGYRLMKKSELAIAPLERALAYYETHSEDDFDRGTTRYHLAFALWESKRDIPRALALAKLAADDLAKAHTGELLPHYRDELARLLKSTGG
jgi:tetratricopeptide (TPR) repeat protein